MTGKEHLAGLAVAALVALLAGVLAALHAVPGSTFEVIGGATVGGALGVTPQLRRSQEPADAAAGADAGEHPDPAAATPQRVRRAAANG